MAKIELSKSIEAIKLNNRTGIPTTEPPVTIPFGAFISNLEHERDYFNFTFLGDRFRCGEDLLRAAMAPVGSKPPEAGRPAAPSAAPAPQASEVEWEEIKSSRYAMARARVPGGWLVCVDLNLRVAITFYPDPEHVWKAAGQ